jgi:phosphoglycolate phosphatase-like HAD superfamily hydrolase
VNLIFDMDGPLLRLDVDLEEVRIRLGALFAPRGIVRPFRPVLRRIREAATEVGDPSLEAAGLAILSEWECRAAASARPRPGAAMVVSALAARGDRLALLTDLGRACIPLALDSANIPVAAWQSIVTRDDVPQGKPDPSGLRRAVLDLGGGPTWYVVDHRREAETGRGLGLLVAALIGDMESEAALRSAGAERILSSLDEILTLPP